MIIETSTGLVFAAHAVVLAARSNFFASALRYHSLGQAEPEGQGSRRAVRILLTDDPLSNPAPPSAEAFVAFLRFLCQFHIHNPFSRVYFKLIRFFSSL